MYGQRNPLKVPEYDGHTELLNQTLGLVQLDSEKDLLACALVARSWVHPSQARIFSTIQVPPGRSSLDRFKRLLETLEGSQHHVGLISQLTIIHHGEARRLRFLQRMVNMRFSRLTTLRIRGNKSFSLAPEAEVIGSLLKSPSLVSVSLEYRLDRLEHFQAMWEGCSTGIKHLKLDILT
ncbi:hypothetical protein FB45DRAFT_481407 [Roridomyces roridus]|uniref:Uncharacterized protein n=1 Tax=Roridomyces roridus TaxID=1738132 RepID=A0AAD7FP85_9AGAR|nr:hypothetical protein FB45DRAFT_481407 [Roridomyces roridus]